jgi:hypothetical protein
VKWTSDASRLYVELRAAAVGWIGLIIGAPDGGMGSGGDCWMGWVDPATGAVHMQARMAVGLNLLPRLDAQQDLTDVVGYITGGITQISFARALNTGDSADLAIPPVGIAMTLSWAVDAYGPGAVLQPHSDRGGHFSVTWIPVVSLVVDPPSAPGSLVLQSASTTTLTFGWLASVEHGSPVIGYTVQFSLNVGSGLWLDGGSVSIGVLSATLSSLSSQTDYWVQVRAISGAGFSPWSAAVQMTTFTPVPPSAPRWLPVVLTAASNSSLQLQFAPSLTAGSSAVVSYQLFLLNNSASTISVLTAPSWNGLSSTAALAWAEVHAIRALTISPADPMSAAVTGLAPGSCYPLLVVARNSDATSAFSDVSSGCTLANHEAAAMPAAVSAATVNLADVGSIQSGVLTSGYPTQLQLQWADGDAQVRNSSRLSFVRYNVQYQALTSKQQLPIEQDWLNTCVLTPVAQCTIASLMPGTFYDARIQAVNVAGASVWSDALLLATNVYAAVSCSGHGTQLVSGVCACSVGYLAADCSVVGSTIALSSDLTFTFAVVLNSSASGGANDMLSTDGMLYGEIMVQNAGLQAGWAGLIIGGSAIDGMSGGDAWSFTWNSGGDGAMV